MGHLTLIILGTPTAKQSVKNTRAGFHYQPKKLVQERDNIRSQIISQLPPGFMPWDKKTGIWITKCLFIFPIVSGLTKKARELAEKEKLVKIKNPDMDNLFKNLFDAMKTIVFLDDCQICALDNVRKLHGVRPRIEIELETLVENRGKKL